MISFFAHGKPAAKGSPRIVTRGRGGVPLPFPRVLKDSPKTESWEHAVAFAAAQAMGGREMLRDVPLTVRLTFVLLRPKGHFGKSGLRASAPRWPAVKPDIDKLQRSTLDAMNGVVFDDDARIVQLTVAKRYGEPIGAEIAVQVCAEEPA